MRPFVYPRNSLMPAVAVTLLCACGAKDPDNPGVAVRDSAGVKIVESFEPAWGEGEGWQLSVEPILDIGVVEGDDAYQLHEVEDVARTAAGDIAVANGGTQEIRVYDSEGRFVRSMGGEGEGPGEFRSLDRIQVRPADTIVGFSFPPRLTAFGPSGELAWTTPLEFGSYQGFYHLESFSDGSFLLAWLMDNVRDLVAEGRVSIGQPVRVPTILLRFSAGGVVSDTVGVFPGFEMAVVARPDGSQGVSEAFAGRNLRYAAQGEFTYVATQEGYEIRIYGRGLTPSRIVRRLGLDLRVTEEAKDSFISIRLEQYEEYPAMRQRYEELLSALPLAGQRAPHGDLQVDSEGSLWVTALDLFALPTPRFDIFDPEGRWLGEMTVPEGFQVFEIGEDYVLGVAQDELDVEHVRMYGLTR